MKTPNPEYGTVQECETCERQMPSYNVWELWNKGWERYQNGWICRECQDKLLSKGAVA
jgi:hypothetical protein